MEFNTVRHGRYLPRPCTHLRGQRRTIVDGAGIVLEKLRPCRHFVWLDGGRRRLAFARKLETVAIGVDVVADLYGRHHALLNQLFSVNGPRALMAGDRAVHEGLRDAGCVLLLMSVLAEADEIDDYAAPESAA